MQITVIICEGRFSQRMTRKCIPQSKEGFMHIRHDLFNYFINNDILGQPSKLKSTY